MADMKQNVPDRGDPNYTGASRLDKGAFNPVGQQADAEFNRDRYSALMNLVGTGIKATDTFFEKSAEKEAQDIFTTARDEHTALLAKEDAAINPDLAPALKGLEQNVPPDFKGESESLQRLQAAKDQGKLTNTAYYAQLESKVRELKSRYPGYKDTIDKTVHSITGITPANALQASLKNDLDLAAQAAKEKRSDYEKFVERAGFAGTLPVGWERMSEDDVRQSVFRIERERADVTAAKSALDLARANKAASKEEREEAADNLFMTSQVEFQSKVQNGYNKMLELAKADQLTPEIANQTLFDLRAKRKADLVKLAQEAHLTPEQLAKYDAIIDKEMNELKENIENKNFGLMDLNKIQHEAAVSKSYRDAYNNSEYLQTMETFKQLPQSAQNAILIVEGSKVAGKGADWLNRQPGFNNASSQAKAAVKNEAVSIAADATKGKQSLTPVQRIERIINLPGGKNPAVLRSHIQDWVNLSTNKDIPDEMKKGVINSFFSAENKDFLQTFSDPSSRTWAFNAFTSKEMQKEMEKYKGQQEYFNYSTWVKANFRHVFRSQIESLKDIQNRPFIKLGVNEATGMFTVEQTNEGKRSQTLSAEGKYVVPETFAIAAENRFTANYKKTVDELNSTMMSLKPIIEGEGYNQLDEIRNLINYEAIHDKKNEGVWSYLIKLMGPHGKGDTTDKFGGANISFSEASGETGKSRGLVSLMEDTSIDPRVKDTAQGYYKRGMAILEGEGKMPTHIAQGFMANFKVESGFADEVISGKRRGDSGQAVGVAQWHPDRQARFQQAFGKPLTQASYEEQLRFVIYELNHMESGAKEKIMQAKTAAEAAALVDKYYERSSGEHRSKRIAAAMAYASQ